MIFLFAFSSVDEHLGSWQNMAVVGSALIGGGLPVFLQ